MKYEYVEEQIGTTIIDKGVAKTIGPFRTIKYKVTPSGTAYHYDTPDDLVEVLEGLRSRGTRIRIYYGSQDTGLDWEEQYDVFGTIGRSTGRIKIPLLIANSRSLGGGSLLDNAIVKIEHANKRDGGVIWQHPKYHRSEDRYQATRSYYKQSSKPSRARKYTSKKSPSSMVGGMR